MPEFFIKIYMDMFDIKTKKEAEQKIKETPLAEDVANEPVVLKKSKRSKLFECFKP